MRGCLIFTNEKKKCIKMKHNLRIPQKLRHLANVACLKTCACTVYQHVSQAVITCTCTAVTTVTLCKRKLSLMNLCQ